MSAPLARRLILSLLALAAVPSGASAQDRCYPFPVGEMSAFRYHVAPDDAFVLVDDPDVDGEIAPYVGVNLDYGHRPFALDNIETATCDWSDPPPPSETDVNGGTFTTQILASLSLFSRVRVGLSLPIVPYTFGDGYSWSYENEDGNLIPLSFPGGGGGGLGDPRISVVGDIMDPDETGLIGLGLVGWVTIPLGQLTMPLRYVGEPTVSVGGHIAFSLVIERFTAAINVGGSWRDERQLIYSRRTAEMTYGAAVRYDFDQTWSVVGEITGQTTFGLVFDDEAPTEIRARGVARVDDVVFNLGLGAGIAYAIGVPVVRVEGGVAWSPIATPDSDQDGIDDTHDSCPAEAEDMDDFSDEDGCPDIDDDEDRILDVSDGCRTEPEDMDGVDDEDGCPDDDDDHDGVSDGFDGCLGEPEDMDGDRDHDGCPDLDTDRDRINDDVDRCPNEPEDTDGLGDEDGCPDPDFDGDGILDEEDECADHAEDRDGYQDTDGCPEAGTGGASGGGGRRRRTR
jgi:OmpA-OmpF porin, OOP family